MHMMYPWLKNLLAVAKQFKITIEISYLNDGILLRKVLGDYAYSKTYSLEMLEAAQLDFYTIVKDFNNDAERRLIDYDNGAYTECTDLSDMQSSDDEGLPETSS